MDEMLYASADSNHMVFGNSLEAARADVPLDGQELEPKCNTAELAERVDSNVQEVDYRKMAPAGKRRASLRVHDAAADAASLDLGQMILC